MEKSYGPLAGEANFEPQPRIASCTDHVNTVSAEVQNSLEKLVGQAPTAMALLNESGHHIEASHAYCVRLGLCHSIVLGKSLDELLPGLPLMMKTALSKSLDGEPATFTGAWNTWTFHPWRGGTVLFVHEIVSHTHLVQFVSANDQRMEENARAERVCRTAGNIAHDLNNMLLVINGYASLLMEELGPDSTVHFRAGAILRAGERVATLSAQLAALSQP